MEHREIDGGRHRATPLSLVACASARVQVDAGVVVTVLEHPNVGRRRLGSSELSTGLRSWTGDGHRRRDWGRRWDCIHLEVAVSILERFKRNELGQLATQHFAVSSQMVDHDAGCLLVFGEVAALVETARAGRIHEEVWRPVELDDQAAGPRRKSAVVPIRLAGFQGDIFDESEGKFDLVAGRIVIDVVGQACFVGRIEDDQVHGILADAAPASDAEGPTGEVLNDWAAQLVILVNRKAQSKITVSHTNFARAVALTVHRHSRIAMLSHGTASLSEQVAGKGSA